jgi:Spy/CpxP family protein refolding chaperone
MVAKAAHFAVWSVSVVALGLAGCGAGAVTGSRSASGGTGDPVNQLTAGATVDGFQDFAAAPGTAQDASGTARLSDEQIAQISDLQAQVDAGTLDQQSFARQVQGIIGDAAPNRALAGFDFFGGPFGGRLDGDLAARLQLTDEQRSQLLDILISLHDDIAALRTGARDQILALLTVEQRATLEQLLTRPGRRVGPNLEAQQGGRGAGHSQGHHEGAGPFQRLIAALDLTADQQAQIQTILTDLRTAVMARHAQARDEFRALLTPDQLALVDAMEANPSDDVVGATEGDATAVGHVRQ